MASLKSLRSFFGSFGLHEHLNFRCVFGMLRSFFLVPFLFAFLKRQIVMESQNHLKKTPQTKQHYKETRPHSLLKRDLSYDPKRYINKNKHWQISNSRDLKATPHPTPTVWLGVNNRLRRVPLGRKTTALRFGNLFQRLTVGAQSWVLTSS